MPNEPPLLTISEAARRLSVHPETLRRWERAGEVASVRTLGGHRRFRADDIDAILDRMAAA